MPSTDFSKPPRSGGSRRPIVALVIVVVLCLTTFLLGIMVGKRLNGAAPEVTSAPASSAVSAAVTYPVAIKAPAVSSQPAAMTASGSLATPALDSAAAGSLPVPEVQTELAALGGAAPPENGPLGSGLNPQTVAVQTSAGASAPPASDDVAPPIPVLKQDQNTVVSSVGSTQVARANSELKEGYAVQVGSFKGRSDAEKVQKKLQSSFPVFIQQVDLGAKGVWFRVTVGLYSSQPEADRVKKQLQENQKLSGFVKKVSL